LSIHDEIKALAATPLFRSVDPSRLRLIAMVAELRRFEDGEDIIVQGGEPDAVFVVLEGRSQVLLEAEGTVRELEEIGQHGVIGEMGVLNDQPRSATVRAIGSVRTLRIARDDMLDLLRNYPDLSLEMLRLLANRLRSSGLRLAQSAARN
jgi:CRP-like cAMP-binding protein